MTTVPIPCVVDTNVALVAEGKAAQASRECLDLCIDLLREIMARGRIVLDHRDLILAEYRRKMSFAGEPGVFESFVKWAHDSAWDEQRCLQVRITPRGLHGDCEEFPTTPSLEKFDLSDRKFVAVAAVSKAPIVNAIDSDWKHHAEALAEAGIRVIFLCPDELKPAAPNQPLREPRTAQIPPHAAPLLVGKKTGAGRQSAVATGGGGVPRRRTRSGGKD